MNTPETEQAWNKVNRNDASGFEIALAMRNCSIQMETERNEARKQRDELMDCLIRLLPYVSPIVGNNAYTEARKAIANVKGDGGEQ